MAFWYAIYKTRTLIMTTKVASTSMRNVLTKASHHVYRELEQHQIGICLREPLDRFRSALTCDTTPNAMMPKPHDNLEQLLDELEAGRPVHSHVAPQLDYIHWRITRPDGGTHDVVPRAEEPLKSFTPHFVFIYERRKQHWPRLLEWMGKAPRDFPHIKKRIESEQAIELEQQFEEIRSRLEVLYARDIEFYNQMLNGGTP